MKLKSILTLLFVFVSIGVASVGWAGWKQQSAAACEYTGDSAIFWEGGASGYYIFCPVEETESFRVNSVTAIKLDITGEGTGFYTRVCTELAGGFGTVCSNYRFIQSSGTDWKVLSGSDLAPWSDPHPTAGFRFFVIVLGSGAKFRGYLVEHR